MRTAVQQWFELVLLGVCVAGMLLVNMDVIGRPGDSPIGGIGGDHDTKDVHDT